MKHCPKCKHTYSDTQRFCVRDGELLSLRDPYHLVGRTLDDKYRIEALAGIGGMGAVYSAHHLGLDRRVAFKILLPHLALSNPQNITLFEREAKIAGRLFHENIVNIFDAGRTGDDIAYIAMEWLDGRTLEDELTEQGSLSFERAAEILRQVASALEEAHARHIVHRDLKPSNVMLVRRLDGRERVKVLDFGIGKVLNATAGAQVSSVMGTPHYASPEQFQVGAGIDGRSDIYSLGVMLYEMLSGQIPFNVTSVHELIRSHLTAEPLPLRELRPETPVAVEELLNRLLAKDPDERLQRVGEIPALFDQALLTPDPPSAEVMKVAPLSVTPKMPREEKDELRSTPPPVTPAPPVEKALPKIEPVNHAEALTPPSVVPAAIPQSLPTPRQTSPSNRFDWRYIAVGAVLIIAISVWLWLMFRPATTKTQSGQTPTPSPIVIPSSEPSKPPVSDPRRSQARSTPEAGNPATPKPSPKQGDGSKRGVEKAIDGALGKEGKEGKEPI